MKKFLSIILACAMIMSLFCVVPVSAAYTTAGDSYWIKDFEDNTTDGLFYNTGTVTAGGYNGSAYSALNTVSMKAGATGKAKVGDVTLANGPLLAFEAGDTAVLTFKYKLTHALAENSVFSLNAAYMEDQGNNKNSATKYPVATYTIADPTDTENWQTATMAVKIPDNAWRATEYGDDGTKNVTSNGAAITYVGYVARLFVLRWGPAGMTGNALASVPTEDIKVGYYIDDIELTRVREQNGVLHQGFNVYKYNPTTTLNSEQAGLQGVYTRNGVNLAVDPTDATNSVYTALSQSNGDLYNLLQFHAYSDVIRDNATIEAGDTINFSAKVMVTGSPYTGTGMSQFQARVFDSYVASTASYTSVWTDLTDAGKVQYLQSVDGDSLKFSLAKNNEWQTISASFTVPENNTGSLGGVRLYLTDTKNSAGYDDPAAKDKKVDMGDATFYFDDVEITVNNHNRPTATMTSAEVDEDGVVTSDYNFAAAATDTNGTNASAYKLLNANGGVIASGLVNAGITVPEGATATTLEIVPVSSTGYIGKAVTCAIEEAEEEVEPIDGTYFSNLAGNLTLSSGEAIENAKIIFVTYDANGKMVDFDIVSDVDVAVNGTINVAPSKVLNAGTKSVVMLWQDMVNCKPLADALAY